MYGFHYTDFSLNQGIINSITACTKSHPNGPKYLRRAERIPFANKVFTGPLLIKIALAPEVFVRNSA
jgi:hypothetical protein